MFQVGDIGTDGCKKCMCQTTGFQCAPYCPITSCPEVSASQICEHLLKLYNPIIYLSGIQVRLRPSYMHQFRIFISRLIIQPQHTGCKRTLNRVIVMLHRVSYVLSSKTKENKGGNQNKRKINGIF